MHKDEPRLAQKVIEVIRPFDDDNEPLNYTYSEVVKVELLPVFKPLNPPLSCDILKEIARPSRWRDALDQLDPLLESCHLDEELSNGLVQL